MTIDKAQLKALVDSPRCGVSWPQYDSVCGKTKDDRRGTWQCGECARKEASALRAEMDKYFGLFREADEHANHWQGQSLIKSRTIGELTREVAKLKAELAGLRTGCDAQNAVIAELRKDAERLDWIDDNYTGHGGGTEFNLRLHLPCDLEEGGLRHAIDAVMAKEASHE